MSQPVVRALEEGAFDPFDRLPDRGVDRIVAGTDVTNTPMAATFARAG